MKFKVAIIIFCLSDIVHAASPQWKEECVGYYKMEMPANLEVALYPIDGVLNTQKRPQENDGRERGYFAPRITFGEYGLGMENPDSSQAQFSVFKYAGYKISISTKNKETIDFDKYKNKIEEIIDVQYKAWIQQLMLENPEIAMTESKIDTKSRYKIKKYTNAFSLNKLKYYELHFNIANRLYIFRPKAVPQLEKNKAESVDEASQIMEPVIQSLIKRFHSRELYEVPAEQGFCLPYGFVAGDSGQEPHEIGVTYRLIDHPDVTIFFRALGVNEEVLTDEGSIKEAVTKMWNQSYLMGADKKEMLSPKWQRIEMDGREGMATYVKATYNNFPTYDYAGHVTEYNNYINYGYLAYIRGDKNTRNKEPGLLLYVSQFGHQAKNKQPMDKDELFKIAEHITRTVQRR
ncbi:T6SS immunity protein Tli4 family protein [Huaxiibacter chinensis]|uniref:T6SS immunity protein Tli4 family protein n=1 Tax=Huaxiibacter chinensis TaxID=2899785 RepID=UPI003D313633